MGVAVPILGIVIMTVIVATTRTWLRPPWTESEMQFLRSRWLAHPMIDDLRQFRHSKASLEKLVKHLKREANQQGEEHQQHLN